MRNWHHLIIRVNEARQAIATMSNPPGDTNLHVGLIEGELEYVIVPNPAPSTSAFLADEEYHAAHPAFNPPGIPKKVFYRVKKDGFNADEFVNSIYKLKRLLKPNFHTNSVGGIMAAMTNPEDIEGILPIARMINTASLYDAFLLGRVNQFSRENIDQSFYFKRKVLNTFLTRVEVPRLSPNSIYSDFRASVINCSFTWQGFEDTVANRNDRLTNTGVEFIQQELFAYGREGRGILTVFSAGNTHIEITDQNRPSSKGSKAMIVSASKVDPAQNNYAALDNYIDHPETMPENFASAYSNYGERVDICAPSSVGASPSTREISIYATAMLNCGDVGDDTQVITKTLVSHPSNSELLLSNIDGIFKGQTIELGQLGTFFHEIRQIKEAKIKDANTTAPKPTVKLADSIVYTKNTGPHFVLDGSAVKITVLKVPMIVAVSNTITREFKIADRRGIMLPPTDAAKKQWVYIYFDDDPNLNDPARIIKTQIDTISLVNPDGTFTVRVLTDLPAVTAAGPKLIMIPDQIYTEVVSGPNAIDSEEFSGANTYTCKAGFSMDGFFLGQQVQIGDAVGNISWINYTNKTFETSHLYRAPNTDYDVTSVAYGNYTSSFGGTSAAAPMVTGVAALVLSANPNLTAAEVKHILKSNTDQIGSGYSLKGANKYNYGYEASDNYGTGRVNALKAVNKAIAWRDAATPKPSLVIYDADNNATVPAGTIVNSPDIWISTTNVVTNQIEFKKGVNTQKVKVRVHNSGNLASFRECDVRLLLAALPTDATGAFLDPAAGDFVFPDYWYTRYSTTPDSKPRISLLDVQEIGVISGGSSKEIEFSFDSAALRSETTKFHFQTCRTFLLAHIAPFDGYTGNPPTDIRQNKHLTCKEIVITDTTIKPVGGTTYIPEGTLNITVGTALVEKDFELQMQNVVTVELNTLKVKATRKDRATGNEESVFFSKSGGSWSIEGSANPDWIAFAQPVIEGGQVPNYSNAVFTHTIKVNQDEKEVKLEIINA